MIQIGQAAIATQQGNGLPGFNVEIDAGRFLRALYFRLNVVRLKIPGLQQRISDLPLLTEFFIRELNRDFNRDINGIEKTALDDMMRYSWPGNVRELKNVIESAFNFCEGSLIRKKDLNIPVDPFEASPEGHKIEDIKRQLLADTLKRFGSVKAAAEHLNIPVSTYYRNIKKFGLSK